MTTPDPHSAVRIANCSGLYGERIGAAREMVEGGPIDVLTGDYRAELTTLILAKAQQKDPAAGYVKTFPTQIEQVLGSCLDCGIKIVANAGGLNPTGLAGAVGDVAARLRLDVRVAHVEVTTCAERCRRSPQRSRINGFRPTPTSESAYGVYRPASVSRGAVKQVVVMPDGVRRKVPDPRAYPARSARQGLWRQLG